MGDDWAGSFGGAVEILTVKVGSSGAAWVAGSATDELSSLRTFWSSALAPPTRKAALAAAAATLNLILESRVLSRADQERDADQRGAQRKGTTRSMEKGRNCQPRQTTRWDWAVMSLQLEGKGEITRRLAGCWCGEFEARQAISDNVSLRILSLELLPLSQPALRGPHGGPAGSNRMVPASLQKLLEPSF